MEERITYEQAYIIASEIYVLVRRDKLLDVPHHYHTPVFAMRGLPTNSAMDELTQTVMHDFRLGDQKILKIYSRLKANGGI